MDEKTIWRNKVIDLEGRGWTLTGIGLAVGLSAQSISDIKQGRTRAPGGMAAVHLNNLHSTGAKPQQVAAPINKVA